VQGDGKIVVVGGANIKKAGTEFAIARYTTSGSLDTSFGSNGIVTTQLGTFDVALAMTLQSDGKIIAAGFSQQTYGQYDFALTRYTTNGSLDSSFGSGGKVLTSISGDPDTGILGITLQSDGKIVVAGWAGTVGSTEQFTVARYNANGSLDTSFGAAHTGIFIMPAVAGGNAENATSVVVQTDGKIVAAGWVHMFGYDQWVTTRFNSDGSVDSAFGSGGTVTTLIGGGGDANAVSLQSDGEIVVAGGPNYSVARFNTDGSLDTNFNGTGTVTTQIGSGGTARSMVIQPTDGKIVLAGDATVNGVSDFAMARYLASDPVIGSFTANPNPVASGSTTTLTVSNITDANPSVSITQVAFYEDSNGDGMLERGTDTLLGYATQTNPGVWTLNYTVNLAAGTYTLFAQAEDNYSLFSDPIALTLTVQ
jgi:uncharacterized delta-60 repeat protein